jgi:hypothetical protein
MSVFFGVFVLHYVYFLLPTYMALTPVVEERHVVHHDDDTASSSAMLIVLLVAAALIVGFLLFALRAFPFNGANGATQSEIDVDLPNVPAVENNVNTPVDTDARDY